MSRNGAGVYSLPAGSTIANGDTSDASDLNTPLQDIETDLNTARPIVAGGTGASSASGARTALGLAIGTNVQAYDAALDDISGLAVTDGNIIVGNGTNWVAESGATARTSLGLAIGTNVQAYDAGLTSVAGLTTAQGDILYLTASDTYAALNVGTAGQFLQVNSGATAPEWASPVTVAQAYLRWTTVTTSTISEDYAVTSLTDNGTGDTTVNFDGSTFNAATYAAVATCNWDTGSSAAVNVTALVDDHSTSSCRVRTWAKVNSNYTVDNSEISLVCFGGQ